MEKKSSDSSSTDRVTTSSSTDADTRQTGTVNVQILGQTLPIRSDQDPEFVQEIADYVADKVRQVRESAPGVPTDKQLMLASMSVAEELFEQRSENDELKAEIEERVDTISDLLERLQQ
ncbi:MAG: cell division protein ZapA [Bradymonadaceae bacterium]